LIYVDRGYYLVAGECDFFWILWFRFHVIFQFIYFLSKILGILALVMEVLLLQDLSEVNVREGSHVTNTPYKYHSYSHYVPNKLCTKVLN